MYNHGINKDDLFYNEDNYNFFLKKLKFYICPIAEIYSYSLLPNHFHLMVKIKSKEAIKLYYDEEHTKKGIPFRVATEKGNNLIKKDDWGNTDSYQFVHYFVNEQFRRLFVSYSKALNKQRSRMGSLFCKGFKRKCVEDPLHFTWLVFYIHSNAEKHGLIKDFKKYQYSSYFPIIDNCTNWILKDAIFEWFRGKKNTWSFMNQTGLQLIKQNLCWKMIPDLSALL